LNCHHYYNFKYIFNKLIWFTYKNIIYLFLKKRRDARLIMETLMKMQTIGFGERWQNHFTSDNDFTLSIIECQWLWLKQIDLNKIVNTIMLMVKYRKHWYNGNSMVYAIDSLKQK